MPQQLTDADRQVLNSLKELFHKFELLDGPRGDWTGLLTDSRTSWHLTTSFIFRCYILSNWIPTAPRTQQLSTPELQDGWNQLLAKTEDIIAQAGPLAARLQRELSGAGVMSSSEGAVIACGVAVGVAGALCGIATDGLGLVACIQAANEAWNYCKDAGNDRGDDGRGNGGRDDGRD